MRQIMIPLLGDGAPVRPESFAPVGHVLQATTN